MKGSKILRETYSSLGTGSQYFVFKVKKLSWKQWLASFLAIAVIAGLVIWFTRPEPVEEVLPVVSTETVTTQDVMIYGEYPGNVRAQQFVEIRARVEGYLEQMLFEEGTYVKKDQVLFIIDPRQYKAQVERAKALLEKNKALVVKAKRDYDRTKPLYDKSAASQVDLDNALAA